MAASTVSYDNVMAGAADPAPGRVVILGRPYHLPQGYINMLTDNNNMPYKQTAMLILTMSSPKYGVLIGRISKQSVCIEH